MKTDKQGNVNIKSLSNLIGLSSPNGYQAIQRKLKGTDLLVGRMHVRDAGRVAEMYKDFMVNKYGEDHYSKVIQSFKPTENQPASIDVETNKPVKFAFLNNPKILLRLAGVAMLIQALAMTKFLMSIHDINFISNYANFYVYLWTLVYLLESVTFQMTVLFLASRGGWLGKFWIFVFAVIDFLVNAFLVDLITWEGIQQFIATIPIPLMIGAFIYLFSSKLN